MYCLSLLLSLSYIPLDNFHNFFFSDVCIYIYHNNRNIYIFILIQNAITLAIFICFFYFLWWEIYIMNKHFLFMMFLLNGILKSDEVIIISNEKCSIIIYEITNIHSMIYNLFLCNLQCRMHRFIAL